MDDIFSSLQPPTDPTPAPAPVEPVAALPEPATPVPAPAEPAADDSSEWDDAINNMFPQVVEGEKPSEPAKPKEDPEAASAGAPATPPEDPAADPAAADPSAKPAEEEVNAPEPTAALTRLNEREQQAEVEAVRSDIREKMFPDVQTQLVDGTGAPIKTVSDVMTFINPDTGEAFTRDEAAVWLSDAERTLDNNVKTMNATVEQAAQINIAIKDEADIIDFNYGELLKQMPEVRAKLWNQYEKSLERDPKSGIIIGAKLSLKDFYETALEPYAALGRKLESDAAGQAAAEAASAAAKAEADKAAKQQRRADRSDIFTGGKTESADPEDDEWGEAAKAVFGDQLKR